MPADPSSPGRPPRPDQHQPSAELPTRDAPGQNPTRTTVNPDDLRPGDAYMEGPYLVFTAQYHLRRGYCCNSGCRHCPYS